MSTWSATDPTDTEKIRLLGQVIRPNWNAIETADSSFLPQAINFKNRTPSIVPINPAAIADSLIAFSKDDASSVAQLFSINENSEIEQLTGNLSSNTLNKGGGTYYTYKIPGALGIILKFGQCNSNTYGSGGTEVEFAAGDHFPTNNLGVILSVSSTASITYSADTLTTAGFQAYNSNGSLTSYFFAWGN